LRDSPTIDTFVEAFKTILKAYSFNNDLIDQHLFTTDELDMQIESKSKQDDNDS
jgi:hypothetical protein